MDFDTTKKTFRRARTISGSISFILLLTTIFVSNQIDDNTTLFESSRNLWTQFAHIGAAISVAVSYISLMHCVHSRYVIIKKLIKFGCVFEDYF